MFCLSQYEMGFPVKFTQFKQACKSVFSDDKTILSHQFSQAGEFGWYLGLRFQRFTDTARVGI